MAKNVFNQKVEIGAVTSMARALKMREFVEEGIKTLVRQAQDMRSRGYLETAKRYEIEADKMTELKNIMFSAL